MAFGDTASITQVLLAAIAFACLSISRATSDFSLRVAGENSHTANALALAGLLLRRGVRHAAPPLPQRRRRMDPLLGRAANSTDTGGA